VGVLPLLCLGLYDLYRASPHSTVLVSFTLVAKRALLATEIVVLVFQDLRFVTVISTLCCATIVSSGREKSASCH
jgi:hypothetical protein